MNEQLWQRLDLLAERMGVTAAHLWDVLVRQAYVNAVEAGLFLALVLAAAAALRRWWRWWLGIEREWERTDKLLPLAIATAVVAAAGLAAVACAIDALGGVLNPEYYALSKVLSALSQ